MSVSVQKKVMEIRISAESRQEKLRRLKKIERMSGWMCFVADSIACVKILEILAAKFTFQHAIKKF